MVTLYVLRHAKAAMAKPGMRDFDRPLDIRGENDCRHIAKMLRERGFRPDAVLCSPAARTRMTLAGVLAAWDEAPSVAYDQNLYSGSPDAYWEALRLQEQAGPAMIVGHNPMCEILAHEAAPAGNEAALAVMRTKYPTGALAVVEFPEARSWSEIRPGAGRLVDFVAPKEL